MSNFIVIRHGRNDYEGPNAGELNDAGKAFARSLTNLHAVRSRRGQFAGIVCSGVRRNQDTIRHIAAEYGLTVKKPGDWDFGGSVRQFVGAIAQRADDRWWIAGIGSQDLEALVEVFPGCDRMIQNYELLMTFSNRVDDAYQDIETIHFNPLMYGRQALRKIQVH